MTPGSNNADNAANSADMVVDNAEIQISKSFEPGAPLFLKPGWERLPDIKRADQLLGDHAIKIPPEIVAGLIHQGTKAILGGSSKAGKS